MLTPWLAKAFASGVASNSQILKYSPFPGTSLAGKLWTHRRICWTRILIHQKRKSWVRNSYNSSSISNKSNRSMYFPDHRNDRSGNIKKKLVIQFSSFSWRHSATWFPIMLCVFSCRADACSTKSDLSLQSVLFNHSQRSALTISESKFWALPLSAFDSDSGGQSSNTSSSIGAGCNMRLHQREEPICKAWNTYKLGLLSDF